MAAAPQSKDAGDPESLTDQTAIMAAAETDHEGMQAQREQFEENEVEANSADITEEPKPPEEVPESSDTRDASDGVATAMSKDPVNVEEQERHIEEEGDHVLEGDEDTVIY